MLAIRPTRQDVPQETRVAPLEQGGSAIRSSQSSKSNGVQVKVPPSARESKESTAENPPLFCCPLSKNEIMEEPVVASDGYTYDRKNIEEKMKSREVSKLSGKRFSSLKILPNYRLRSQIKAWTSSGTANAVGISGDVPDALCCPISLELIKNPVVCADGHTYDKESIEEWFEGGSVKNSPMTGRPMNWKPQYPNLNLKAQIDEFLQKQATPKTDRMSGLSGAQTGTTGTGSSTATRNQGVTLSPPRSHQERGGEEVIAQGTRSQVVPTAPPMTPRTMADYWGGAIPSAPPMESDEEVTPTNQVGVFPLPSAPFIDNDEDTSPMSQPRVPHPPSSHRDRESTNDSSGRLGRLAAETHVREVDPWQNISIRPRRGASRQEQNVHNRRIAQIAFEEIQARFEDGGERKAGDVLRRMLPAQQRMLFSSLLEEASQNRPFKRWLQKEKVIPGGGSGICTIS